MKLDCPSAPAPPAQPGPMLKAHLKLPKGIVTLLLARGLLGAHGDELVDTVCHRPDWGRGVWD